MSIESLEFWKNAFEILGVVLLLLTFVAGAGVLWFSKKLNAVQAEQLRQFDKGLTDAKIELGKQQERTAGAEKAASDAALALAKFRAPRSLSPKQQENLIAALKPFPGQNFACAVLPDPEPLALLVMLDTLLKEAGWKRVPSQIQREGVSGSGVMVEVAGESAATIFDSGIVAYIAPDDQDSASAQHAFCSALMAAGILCENHRTPQLANKNPRAITISVGKKP